MKYYTINFLVDVTDNSMSPVLIKGDTVTVCPGFKVEDGHMVALLITDEKERTTKLSIRKAVTEDGGMVFKAANHDYPSFVIDESNNDNIRVVGIVTKLHRYFGAHTRPNFIVTAEPARRNRIALESQSDNLVLNEMEEIK